MASFSLADFVTFLRRHQDSLLDEQDCSPHSYNLIQNLLSPAPGIKPDTQFHNHWKFYLDETTDPKVIPVKDYGTSLKILGELDNVEEFCQCWNSLSSSTCFELSSDLRLFKEGIRPLWEDPENAEGGRFMMAFTNIVGDENASNKVITHFLNLLIHMVCGQLGSEDEICGAGLSIRKWGLSITLWNKTAAETPSRLFIEDRLKEILPADPRYQAHQSTIKNHDRSRNYVMRTEQKSGDNTKKRGQHDRKRSREDIPKTKEQQQKNTQPKQAPQPTVQQPASTPVFHSKVLQALKEQGGNDITESQSSEDSDSQQESAPLTASAEALNPDSIAQEGDEGEWKVVKGKPLKEKKPKQRNQRNNQKSGFKGKGDKPLSTSKGNIRKSSEIQRDGETKEEGKDGVKDVSVKDVSVKENKETDSEEKPKSTWTGWAKPVAQAETEKVDTPKGGRANAVDLGSSADVMGNSWGKQPNIPRPQSPKSWADDDQELDAADLVSMIRANSNPRSIEQRKADGAEVKDEKKNLNVPRGQPKRKSNPRNEKNQHNDRRQGNQQKEQKTQEAPVVVAQPAKKTTGWSAALTANTPPANSPQLPRAAVAQQPKQIIKEEPKPEPVKQPEPVREEVAPVEEPSKPLQVKKQENRKSQPQRQQQQKPKQPKQQQQKVVEKVQEAPKVVETKDVEVSSQVVEESDGWTTKQRKPQNKGNKGQQQQPQQGKQQKNQKKEVVHREEVQETVAVEEPKEETTQESVEENEKPTESQAPVNEEETLSQPENVEEIGDEPVEAPVKEVVQKQVPQAKKQKPLISKSEKLRLEAEERQKLEAEEKQRKAEEWKEQQRLKAQQNKKGGKGNQAAQKAAKVPKEVVAVAQITTSETRALAPFFFLIPLFLALIAILLFLYSESNRSNKNGNPNFAEIN